MADLRPADLKLAYCLSALQQAILRFEQTHWHLEEQAFAAAAEAVSWVVAMDSILEAADFAGRDPRTYKRDRAVSEDGRTIIGMKYVRNHVHHAAEMLDFVAVTAVLGNSLVGFRSFWQWTSLGELGSVDDRFTSGRGLYASHVGGRGVLNTLLDANQFFAALDPPLPPLPPDPSGASRRSFELPVRWPPVEGERRV